MIAALGITKDWAEIGGLVSAGVEVHFATESLDLNTLGGMLSADLQAVMSVHYSRNLREDVKKGYYGRLKQGLCPYPAPLGYLDCGGGKPKKWDPVKGPLVMQGFELYATGRYSQYQLTEELYKMGLRTKAGKKVSRNVVAGILANPFYIGVLHIKKTSRTFAGIHEPLISKQIFDRVQEVMAGRYVRQIRTHRFPFSRMISCSVCGRSLIAEIQKGHVYYRCHSRHEPPSILRQEDIEDEISKCFEYLRLLPEENDLVDAMLRDVKENWESYAKETIKAEQLKLDAIRDRIERLTDAYLDGLVDKQQLEQKKTALTLERGESERRISNIQNGDTSDLVRVKKIVERIKNAYSLYKDGSLEEKQDVVKDVLSNRTVSGKTLAITLRTPFVDVAKCNGGQFGGPPRGVSRTWEHIFNKIGDHIRTSELEQDAGI